MNQKLLALVTAEDGQAMTSSASFLGGCALIAVVAYYYFGAAAYNFINTITSSAPPGTSAELFQ